MQQIIFEKLYSSGGSLRIIEGFYIEDFEINFHYAKALAKNGYHVIIRSHQEIPGVKNPELDINGKTWDIKRVFPKNSLLHGIQKAIKRANHQLANPVIVIQTKDFIEDSLRRALIASLGKNPLWNTHVTEVIILLEESDEIVKLYFFTRNQIINRNISI